MKPSTLRVFLLCSGFAIISTAQADGGGGELVLSKPRATWSSEGSAVRLIPSFGAAAMGVRSDDRNSGLDTGVSTGALVDFGNGSLTFETGLLYEQFGGNGSFDGRGSRLNLSYLGIPVVGKLNFSGDADRTFFLKGGLRAMALTSQSSQLNGKSTSPGAAPTDLDAVVGIGGAIPVSSTNSLVLDASYLRGLTKINQSGPSDFRNEGFVLTAGVSIGID